MSEPKPRLHQTCERNTRHLKVCLWPGHPHRLKPTEREPKRSSSECALCVSQRKPAEIILHSLITEVACRCQGWDKPSPAEDTELLGPTHSTAGSCRDTRASAPWTSPDLKTVILSWKGDVERPEGGEKRPEPSLFAPHVPRPHGLQRVLTLIRDPLPGKA